MRICVLTMPIQGLGGVQRVISVMFNRLVNRENYDIFFLETNHTDNIELYYVDHKIKSIYLCDYQYKVNVLKKLKDGVLRRLHRRYGILNNRVELCDEVFYSRYNINKVSSWAQENKIDCLIGVDPFHSILAAKISLITGIRCVAWMHSTYEAYFHIKGYGFYGMEALLKKYAKYFDSFLVLTNKDKVVSNECINELKNKTYVQYNPTTILVDGKSSLDTNKLLYVGRLAFQPKGCDRLVLIMEKIVKKFKNVTLDIVGDGPDKKRLIKLIKAANLENNIYIQGMSNDVDKYYKSASVLLMPSRNEGFGLVITEAMAYGIPVVAFETYGANEIIDNSQNGYLIPQDNNDLFADKVINLLTNNDILNDMSEKALQRANDFNLDNILDRLINIVSDNKLNRR